MYLLDKVIKVDEKRVKDRCFIVEEGRVRYATTTFKQWNKKRVSMNGTVLCSGRVYFDDSLLYEGGDDILYERQKQLIKDGCTTVAIAPHVKYESELANVYHNWNAYLKKSTIDYVIGLTIPAYLIRMSFIRKCQNMLIPYLKVELTTEEDIHSIKWTHISHTLLHYPLAIIPVFQASTKRAKSLEVIWRKYCLDYGIHTDLDSQYSNRINKSLLQKIGLFPQKGTLIAGSDLDYIAYVDRKRKKRYEERKRTARDIEHYKHEEPDLVVLRGRILKVLNEIDLKPGFGQPIQIIRPGRFLSMNDLMEQENHVYRSSY
ncbi:hypothetical protein [Halalkalibacter hemicellulosilyticus]|uniref:Uncharacterized protein n=1 Tax=Halalkalibacter hemicellulosilyticusJCM 9152 TaxID=1236971 RepID=W4QCD9_9BACI|nr:hypothetical protein [Halalkalibacter hemicellulosilyticus]GAE29029.1 hypothetical protein JCM9152_368 [Halalkalibacter hemicellulosilyticusJCM 9152]